MSEVSDIDYATWLTKEQAAKAIGVTPKSIERFADAGDIQSTRWQPGGRGPRRVVYHPDDVAKLAAERKPGPLLPFLVPGPTIPPSNGNRHGSQPQTDALALSPQPSVLLSSGEDLFKALVTAAARVMSQTSQTSERPVLTLDEAVAAFGWSRTYLLRKIHTGTLKAEKDRGWKIRRKDLEAL